MAKDYPATPAFPVADNFSSSGLTLLQYFTAATLQGLLAGDENHNKNYTGIARDAVQYAIATLAELHRIEQE